jgi:hypothetical protein
MYRTGMMIALLTTAALAQGCGSATSSATARRDEVALTTVTEYRGEAVAASALVFAPPVTLDEPPINLDRASRQPVAFFGYDEGSIEYYRLTVDDRQTFSTGDGGGRSWGGGLGGGYGSGWSGRYDRQAVSERVGAIRR